MNPNAKWILTVFAIVAPLLPMAIAGAVLRRLGSDSGVAWAHSLFAKDHPLNFGGNAAEVLSHLLDWIVMTTGMAALCLTAAALSLLRAAAINSPVLRFFPKIAFPITLTTLMTWAYSIDHESGEGTVLPVSVMFFTPLLLIITIGLLKLHECNLNLKYELVPLPILFAASVGSQRIYEPSGSGAPNVLIFPAFLVLAAALLFYCYRVTRKKPMGTEAQ